MKIIPRGEWTPTIPKSIMGAEEIEGTPYFREQEVVGTSWLTPPEDVFFIDINPYYYLQSQLKTDLTIKGYGDIAYNFAVAGNWEGFYCLRGLSNKSSAHRDRQNNSQNVAILVLLGQSEPPTDVMVQNLTACRNFILSKYPNATKILTTLPQGIDYFSAPVGTVGDQRCPLPESFTQDSNVLTFELIEHLSYWGYYRARNDGVYGPVTINAVMELQADLHAAGLYQKRVDGLYGRYTREGFCQYMKSLR